MESVSQVILDLFDLKPNDFFINNRVDLMHKNSVFGSIILKDGHFRFHFETPSQER